MKLKKKNVKKVNDTAGDRTRIKIASVRKKTTTTSLYP